MANIDGLSRLSFGVSNIKNLTPQWGSFGDLWFCRRQFSNVQGVVQCFCASDGPVSSIRLGKLPATRPPTVGKTVNGWFKRNVQLWYQSNLVQDRIIFRHMSPPMLSCRDILRMGMGPKFHPQIIQIGWGAKISGFPPSSPGCHRQWSSSCWWCLSFYCGSSREQGNPTCLPCPSAEVEGHDVRLEELYEVGFGSCPRRLLILPEYYVSFIFLPGLGSSWICLSCGQTGAAMREAITVCVLGAPAHQAVSAASSEAQWQPGAEAQVRLPKKTFDAIKS